MNSYIKRRKYSLMVKLSALVTLAVLMVTITLGFYFDHFLQQRFLQDTQEHMNRGFQRLVYNLKNTEQQLLEGIAFVQHDEKTIASIELINHYQDKQHYNTFLIDEEKKMLALELLNRVKLSFNHDIALYDQNEELIAFVSKENGHYRLNYVSYAAGTLQIFSRLEDYDVYQPSPVLPGRGSITLVHKRYYTSNQLAKGGLTTYQRIGAGVLIKSHQHILDQNNGRVIGHIEMSNILDPAYFEGLSRDVGVDMTASFDASYDSYAAELDENWNVPAITIIQTDQQYIGVLKKQLIPEKMYFVARLNKAALKDALTENRVQLLLLLLLVAALILLLARYVIHHILQQPLALLMAQIGKIEQQDYSRSAQLATGDELQDISQSINQLAQAVQEREHWLEQARSEQEHLSNHDALTGLPNRRYFSRRLQQAMESARREGRSMALLFLDLDQFKMVNDTLGHDVGDVLLVEVARRLTSAEGKHTIARIGGDEFNILVEDSHPEELVEYYLSLFRDPFACNGMTLAISASIGVAIYPRDGEDSVTLIKHADLAMYKSKDKGRNNYSFYSSDLAEQTRQRAEMAQALKAATEAGGQFEMFYQPKIATDSGKIHGVEALIRWHSPLYGKVSPTQFIPLAEETGLIVQIGRWAMRQACHDFMRLYRQGYQLDHISINVSNVQLRNGDMMATLQSVIAESGISPSRVELEITESYIADDVEQAIGLLQSFRNLGIRLSIDDFGTGYSSMSYLQKLPVTRLKIDKSFIDGLPYNKDSITLTRTIITLAENFGLETTAEGVENAEQFDFLVREHCDEIQGYHFGKPLCFNDLEIYCRVGLDAETNIIRLPVNGSG